MGSYEATHETLALLKLLALGREDMAQGRTAPAKGLANRIRNAAIPAAPLSVGEAKTPMRFSPADSGCTAAVRRIRTAAAFLRR